MAISQQLCCVQATRQSKRANIGHILQVCTMPAPPQAPDCSGIAVAMDPVYSVTESSNSV